MDYLQKSNIHTNYEMTWNDYVDNKKLTLITPSKMLKLEKKYNEKNMKNILNNNAIVFVK